MKIKEGVTMYGLQLPMRYVLIEADRIWKEYGQELVVTSATDGEHSPGSLHYYGYALDFRTRYFTDDVKKKVFNQLAVALMHKPYSVLLEKTHIHVQYDKPKEYY